jgi:TPR repeat protein
MYVIGQGVPEDIAEAMKWMLKAAEQGNAKAKEWLEKNAKDESE